MNPDDLVTFRELEHLKYQYLRTLDAKDWDGFRATFLDDATAQYGDRLEFENADEIVEFMQSTLGPSMITLHQVHHPEFTVAGDEATGVWSLQDKVILTDYRLILEGASIYTDTYRRTPEGWRIAQTSYIRQYEYMLSLDDLPSFKLTANRFGPVE